MTSPAEISFNENDLNYLKSDTTHLFSLCTIDCRLLFREYCTLIYRNRSNKKRIFEWTHELFAKFGQ